MFSGCRLLTRNVINDFGVVLKKKKNKTVSPKTLRPVFRGKCSLTKIICHTNFGKEFAFTHSKIYLYY